MFLKLLEAFKSPGDTVLTPILIQQNCVVLRLHTASEASAPNGVIPAEPSTTLLSSRALVTFSSEGCCLSYKPLRLKGPFPTCYLPPQPSRCSRISLLWKDDLRCLLEQNCTSQLYVSSSILVLCSAVAWLFIFFLLPGWALWQPVCLYMLSACLAHSSYSTSLCKRKEYLHKGDNIWTWSREIFWK